jgi:hypothetical protein
MDGFLGWGWIWSWFLVRYLPAYEMGEQMIENETQCVDAHLVETFGAVDLPSEADAPQIADNPKRAAGLKKAPLSVVPMCVIAEQGLAMLEGAVKYGRFNWRATELVASDYFDATNRHLIAWFEGEDIDPDSGLSHITKAISTLVVLRDSMIQGMLIDDRPPRSKPFYPALNAAAANIVDRYADRNQIHYTINGPTK